MDKNAFIQFYNANIEKIYRFIYFKVDSEETAQDLSSESFLKFWHFLSKEKEDRINNHRAFLYRIAKNLVVDFHRDKSRFETVLTSANFDLSTIAAPNDIIEKANLHSEFEQIKKAINKIQPEQQEAVLLRYVEDLSNGEIAQILDKSEGAIRVLVHRGITALRKVLEIEEV